MITRKSVLIVFLCCLAHNLYPQSYISLSNNDFGEPYVMFLDSENYPLEIIDQEQLRILYFCSIDVLGSKHNASYDINDNSIGGRYYLQIGKRITKYQTESRFRADSILINGGSRIVANECYSQKANFVFAFDCYYIDGKELTFTGRLAADDFMYKESLSDIDWTIHDSTKTICGYHCFLAEGSFRGRTYCAWFTTELPAPAGPWKLGGLPGIILQIEDSLHQISMVAEEVIAGSQSIILPKYPYVNVTRKQYSRMLSQLWKNPALFQANHASRSSAVIKLVEGRAVTPLPLMALPELKP